MGAIISIARKDLTLLLRDKTGMIFVIGVPLLFACFFGGMYGGDEGGGGIAVALIDEDQSETSRALVDALIADEAIGVTEMTEAEAIEAVRHGDQAAMVIIREGYRARLGSFMSGEAPEIQLTVDPSRRAEAGMLEGIITRRAMEGLVGLFQDPDRFRPQLDTIREQIEADESMTLTRRIVLRSFFSQLNILLEEITVQSDTEGEEGEAGESSGWMPIQITSAPLETESNGPENPYDVSFPQGIVWGLIAVVMAFSTSLVNERTLGTLVRLRMAPISMAHVLMGKATACFVMCASMMVLLLLFGGLVFEITPHSWQLLILAMISVSVCFTGLMILFSTFGKTERTCGNIGWTLMMIMAMTGGGMIPVFFMPGWLVSASHFSPVRWAVLAIEGGLWRGFSPAEMLMPCVVLLVIGAVSFGLGIKVFKPDV
jgi:ABC-2 type transport system permease protein